MRHTNLIKILVFGFAGFSGSLSMAGGISSSLTLSTCNFDTSVRVQISDWKTCSFKAIRYGFVVKNYTLTQREQYISQGFPIIPTDKKDFDNLPKQISSLIPADDEHDSICYDVPPDILNRVNRLKLETEAFFPKNGMSCFDKIQDTLKLNVLYSIKNLELNGIRPSTRSSTAGWDVTVSNPKTGNEQVSPSSNTPVDRYSDTDAYELPGLLNNHADPKSYY